MNPVDKLRAAASGNGLRAQLLRGGAGSLTLKLCNRGLTLFVAIALARMLGSDGYGVYSFVLAVITLIITTATI